MDATAVSLCMDNDLPIVVFDLMGEGNVLRVVRGERVGTLHRAAADVPSAGRCVVPQWRPADAEQRTTRGSRCD